MHFLKQNIDEKIEFNQTKDQMRALFATSGTTEL